jgi:hypothetical protein
LYAEQGTWKAAMTRANTGTPQWDVAAGTTADVTPGVWQQVTATYNKAMGKLNIYVNGMLTGSVSHSTTWKATGSLRIGSFYSGGATGGFFNGQVANVQAWNTNLPQDTQCRVSVGACTFDRHPTLGVNVLRIPANTRLNANDVIRIGATKLIMQGDGNLVIYDEHGTPRWDTATYNGASTWYTIFQPDGNLVVYNASAAPVWASNTCCNTGYWLAVQEDGNVVIYDSNWTAHWATNTVH